MSQNFCPTCGAELQYKEAEICPKCGVRIKESPKPPGEKHAGFWIRFIANFIDGIILTVIGYALLFLLILLGAMNFSQMAGTIIFWYILIFLIQWMYFAVQESSPKQATIGKQAVGLIVTDLNGNQLSFGRATGRWLAKLLSALILGIGLIMIGFTEKKQGLHDKIVDTYVIYRDRQ